MLVLASCSKEAVTPAPVSAPAAAALSTDYDLGALIKKASPELYNQLAASSGRGPGADVSFVKGRFYVMGSSTSTTFNWTCVQTEDPICIVLVRPAELNAPGTDEILGGLEEGTISGTAISVDELNNLPVSNGNYWMIENDENPSARRLSGISATQNGTSIEGISRFN